MSRIKKVIAGVVVTALLAGAASAGAVYIRKSNETEVLVYDVSSLASDYYSQDTYLDGTVTTSVSQNVTVDKDMIIEDVPVQKGDSVKKGDVLITFDMTLVEMELNIAKLKKQQQEQNLNKAVNRLNSLQNGGPLVEEDDSVPDSIENDTSSLNSTTMNEEASAAAGSAGAYLAASFSPVLLAAAVGDLFSEGTEESGNSDETMLSEGVDQDTDVMTEESSGETPVSDSESGSEFSSGENSGSGDSFISGEIDPPLATPTPVPDFEEDIDIFDPYPTQGDSQFHDGNPVFYSRLDGDSIPFTGRGSETEPYVFLCSSATGKVVLTGEFLNTMAGFSKDGTRVLSENGSWYQLEFHNLDTITNFEDRTQSCTGYYLIDGNLLETPVSDVAEMELTLEDASKYTQEDIEPEIPGSNSGTGGSTSTLTRSEAIKQKQNEIASLKLDIQESEINISKLEKKVQKQVVYSKIDGTVSYVGDPLTGTSSENAFLIVRSKDGYYVKGTVSELMLDEMKDGTILNCQSYENGSFEAEVVDVSDFPVSSGSGYYYGDGNPNASYYTYSAIVTDKSIKLSDQDWLTVTLNSQTSSEGSLVLDKAFVLSEDGVSYVYKDDNGVLKKQVLDSGGNVNGGYSVLVKGGITREDKIACPYGKDIKEGAKTKQGTMEDLYGY